MTPAPTRLAQIQSRLAQNTYAHQNALADLRWACGEIARLSTALAAIESRDRLALFAFYLLLGLGVASLPLREIVRRLDETQTAAANCRDDCGGDAWAVIEVAPGSFECTCEEGGGR